MGGMCREQGVPFVVAIFPLFGNPLDERYPSPRSTRRSRRPRRRRARGSSTCCRSTAASTGELLVVDGADDEHPNEIAHRIAAQAIARAVDEVVPRPARRPRGRDARPAGALALAAAWRSRPGSAIHAMRGNSATFDEGAHLPAGYTHLVLGDHRLNPEQPPLVKLLAAAPLLAVRPQLRTDDRAWAEARQWEFGRRFLYRWNDADRLLFLGPPADRGARLVPARRGVPRGPPPLRRRARRRRRAPPRRALARRPRPRLRSSRPTSRFALFFFLSVVTFERVLERAPRRPPRSPPGSPPARPSPRSSRPRSSCRCSLLLGVLAVLDGRPTEPALRPAGRARAGPRPRQPRWRCSCAATALVALVVVWASYGFRYALSPDPAVRAAAARAARRAGRGPAAARRSRPPGRAGLVPEDYARGLLFVMTHSEARPTFLLGRALRPRLPAYFLVTFLLKTPVPLLLLAALALVRVAAPGRRARRVPVAARRRLRGLHRRRAACRSATATCCRSTRSCSWPPARRRRGCGRGAGRSGLALVGLLGAWYAGGTLRQHPHHLAYFNEIAGGPANGWRLLVDSNLDWGQDLERLAAWMRGERRAAAEAVVLRQRRPGVLRHRRGDAARLHRPRTPRASRARSAPATSWR